MAARTVSTPAAEPARTPSLPATGVIAEVTTQSMPQQTYVERRLTGAGTAGDDDVEPGLDAGAQQLGHLRRQRPEADEVVDGERVLGELPDGQRRPAEGQRRGDRVHAGAVGPAGGDQRRGLVDPPSHP